MGEHILEFQNISKDFSGVKVLQDVSFSIERGSCHCIIGENGAGKSTLIKILTGVFPRSSGKIIFEGEDYLVHSTREAFSKGIACVFQELNMVDSLTIKENITLGRENSRLGIIKKDQNIEIFEVLKEIEPDLRLDRLAGTLSFAQKQMVEIAKAVGSKAKIIILDEPTAALTEDEVEKLFRSIRLLKEKGVSIIYISHRLEELFEIGDKVTVLKDGCCQGTLDMAGGITRKELIRLMTGKILTEHYVPNMVDRHKVVLSVKKLTNNKLKNISFNLYQGEVLGIYGLVGAGKSEIARALYGADQSENDLELFGEKFSPRSPGDSIKKKIVLIPEERRLQGLCTELTILENIPMMNYTSVLSNNKLYSARKGHALSEKFIKLLRIACRNESQMVVNLSGGNQQKVVLAKCLNAEPSLLLLDEPTRGVDVGAKQEIYTLIREMSKNGSSVIVFSSEFPEIANLCDRVILIHDGEIKKVLENDSKLDSEYIMNIVTGGE